MSIIHWIGIDDHADKWTIAHLEGNESELKKEFEVSPSQAGHRRLIAYLKNLEGEVRVVYEAGPCGYELYRRLNQAGVNCQVAAPSLTPRKPGDRVKTNRRDAAKLARYLRSNDLTLISVPDPDREGLRDLTRSREAMQADLTSIRHQISKLLLRYGHRYSEGNAWTIRFWTWVGKIQLAGDTQLVLLEMITTHEQRAAQLARYDARIREAAERPEYASYVAALRTLRGIDILSAMVILAELGDVRRFGSAPQLMAALGLVPAEASTGDKVHRLSITKTGNAHVRHILVEAAWHYRRVTKGRVIRARRKAQPQAIVDIAEKCELRLNRKFHRLVSRNKPSTVAAVAVARELAGFIWAIGHIEHP